MVAILERPILDRLMKLSSQKLVGDWSLKNGRHFLCLDYSYDKSTLTSDAYAAAITPLL